MYIVIQLHWKTIDFTLKIEFSLKEHQYKGSVTGMAQGMSNISACTTIDLVSTDIKYENSLACLILNKITQNLPQISFPVSKLKIPSGIKLADKTFNKFRPIDILIGSTVFCDTITNGKKEIENSNLILQNTKLGWIVSGFIPIIALNKNPISLVALD